MRNDFLFRGKVLSGKSWRSLSVLAAALQRLFGSFRLLFRAIPDERFNCSPQMEAFDYLLRYRVAAGAAARGNSPNRNASNAQIEGSASQQINIALQIYLTRSKRQNHEAE